MSFDSLVSEVDRIAMRALGDPVSYYRNGVRFEIENAVRDVDVEVIGEAGTVISKATVYHLPVEVVGDTNRGELIRDSLGNFWQVLYQIQNDGFMVSVQVAPHDPG
ncbi:MAG: hypothetical protein NXH95_13700 [Pseudomonadaceae bacterium]|nr:hypothetical protein [Pseudomonadaceae bacterium]